MPLSRLASCPAGVLHAFAIPLLHWEPGGDKTQFWNLTFCLCCLNPLRDVQAGANLSFNRQFYDEHWSKHRVVTCMDWSLQVRISADGTNLTCVFMTFA